MTLLLQAITRLVTLVLLAALAIACLAVAIFSVPSAEDGLGQLADLAGLDLARDEVASFLEALEGSAGAPEVLGCLAAVLVGALLIAGALMRRADRSLQLPAGGGGDDDGASGSLAIRRRPLGQMGASLAGRVREAEALSLRVRPKRRSPGGTLRVRARVRRGSDPDATREQIARELRPLTETLAVRHRVTTKSAREKS